MKKILLDLYSYLKKHPILFFLWFFFILINFAVTIRSGRFICLGKECGMYIGSLHNPDSLWHVSLIENAFKTIPFEFPNFAGKTLQGYNYFFDFICFLIAKITHLSAFDIYFRVIPIIYVILFPVLTFLVSIRYSRSIFFVFSFSFFMFFGSSFAYIPALMHTGKLNSYYYAQAMQSGRTLLNMQYGVSILLLQSALIFLLKKQKNKKDYLYLAIILIIATAVKFYIGPILLGMFIVNELVIFIKDKKISKLLGTTTIFSLCFLVSVILFYNISSSLKTGDLFAWSPLSLVHPIIESIDLFYFPSLVQMRYTLYALGGFSIRLIVIEAISIFLFILFNFGTRIIGFFSLVQLLIQRKIKRFDVVIFAGIIIGLIPSLLFVQKGVWWNVVQFFGYSIFLSNFFAAKTLEYLFAKKRYIYTVLVLICIICTLPQNIEQLGFFFEKRVDVSQNELAVYSFAKSQKEKIIITLPVPENSVVSAFSHKQTYIADSNVLTISGVDYKEREKELIPMNWNTGNQKEKKQSLIIIDKRRDSKNMFQTFFSQKKEYEFVYSNQSFIVYRYKKMTE